MMRLLLFFITGIAIQWYGQLAIKLYIFTGIFSLIILVTFFFFPFFHRYKWSFVNGIITGFLFISLAALFTYGQDIRNHNQWFGNMYKDSISLKLVLQEPLIEKARSLKAEATVSFVTDRKKLIRSTGRIIVYFQKQPDNSILNTIGYGSQIIIRKPLQEIINTGNPGSFDYKRYCLFQGITHQVFLKPGEFEILPGRKQKKLNRFIYDAREKILSILRTHIKPEKELGLAEALLVGYKDDLDKSLVQSYSNTGVVHIIAISGLHLGLIYWLLGIFCRPFQRKKNLKWLSPLVIISGLWLFSLLAGAQPSVLRSAVMFTCIITAESISRKSNIYNTLAISAFLLLCYNPFWLWDTGFQLSYAAVLSLVIFMRPVYNILYFKNRWVDSFWKLNAVTIAAQVLTLPLSIYYFHQFPNYFLLANLLAIPLSSLILLIEIFLCSIASIPFLATLTGKLLTPLISFMNGYIEKIESLPFSLWNGLQINFEQLILLMASIACLSYALIEKSRLALKMSLVAVFGFILLRSWSFTQAHIQQKIIVYNIPRQSAIDIIKGRHLRFVGDTSILTNSFINNFYLRPSHILLRVNPVPVLENVVVSDNYINFYDKHVLLVNENSPFKNHLDTINNENRPIIDLLVISGNPRLYLKKLSQFLHIKQVVFDGSVSSWRSKYWKNDCDSLGIPWHDVTIKGAFAMNLP